MEIKGFIETSFVDYDGKVCSVVFLPGCNFRCPFCFNRDIVLEPGKLESVPEDIVFAFLEAHKDFVDGVCITGGEPTLQAGLEDFCRKIKSKGFLVKLDTNGSNPAVLKDLVAKKLVDYVAMDLKGPWEMYPQFLPPTSNLQPPTLIDNLKETAKFLMSSGINYEFRTTIVPSVHTPEVFEKIAAQVKGAAKYCVQKFSPGNSIDPKYNRLKKQTDEEMQKFIDIAKKYVKSVKLRGK